MAVFVDGPHAIAAGRHVGYRVGVPVRRVARTPRDVQLRVALHTAQHVVYTRLKLGKLNITLISFY